MVVPVGKSMPILRSRAFRQWWRRFKTERDLHGVHEFVEATIHRWSRGAMFDVPAGTTERTIRLALNVPNRFRVRVDPLTEVAAITIRCWPWERPRVRQLGHLLQVQEAAILPKHDTPPRIIRFAALGIR